MGQKYTNATPAGIPRSRSKRTRARRKEYSNLQKEFDHLLKIIKLTDIAFRNDLSRMICVSTLPREMQPEI